MKYAIPVIVLIILVVLVIEFNSRMAELNRLEAQREVVAERLSERLQTQEALEQAVARATSEPAAEQYGYENDMAREGDIVVVPIPEYEITLTPPPAPVVQVTQETNWQRWLALFFDPPPPTPAP